jgi:hypothetical protein
MMRIVTFVLSAAASQQPARISYHHIEGTTFIKLYRSRHPSFIRVAHTNLEGLVEGPLPYLM